MNEWICVFWDVKLCHWVRGSCHFGGSCCLQNVGNHPFRHTLTTWKTWILLNTTVRILHVRCHSVACTHVASTVLAARCYMHWMVLTHPVANQDQYPFDFQVFGSFKKSQDLSEMKLERCCSDSCRTPRSFFLEGIHGLECQRDGDLSCNGNISDVLSFFPRSISKWESVEQDEYLNYKDLYCTYFLLNI